MSAFVWGALVAALVGVVFIVRRRVRVTLEADVAKRRPVGANGIVIGADPLFLSGARSHAVLLVHGFNDTPQSMIPLAGALHAAGWTVSVPLLPGHGRPLREFAASREREWIDAVRHAYRELRSTHEVVVVGGLSMGAALSALLAAEHPEMPALVLMAPYLGMPRMLQLKVLLAWIAQVVAPYRRSEGGGNSIHDPVARAQALGPGVVTARMLTELRNVSMRALRALPRVTMPVLYIQSRQDNRIDARAAERHFKRVGSHVRELRWLTGCGHIITADYCKDAVAEQVCEWFTRHAGSPR